MSSLSHKGQACMAWGGNVITHKRFLSPSMHLASLSSVRSHNHGHPISLSTSTTMDMSALLLYLYSNFFIVHKSMQNTKRNNKDDGGGRPQIN